MFAHGNEPDGFYGERRNRAGNGEESNGASIWSGIKRSNLIVLAIVSMLLLITLVVMIVVIVKRSVNNAAPPAPQSTGSATGLSLSLSVSNVTAAVSEVEAKKSERFPIKLVYAVEPDRPSAWHTWSKHIHDQLTSKLTLWSLQNHFDDKDFLLQAGKVNQLLSWPEGKQQALVENKMEFAVDRYIHTLIQQSPSTLRTSSSKDALFQELQQSFSSGKDADTYLKALKSDLSQSHDIVEEYLVLHKFLRELREKNIAMKDLPIRKIRQVTRLLVFHHMLTIHLQTIAKQIKDNLPPSRVTTKQEQERVALQVATYLLPWFATVWVHFSALAPARLDA